MSNTFKDRPYWLGGKRTKYWIASTGHAEFKRQCQRKKRAKVRDALVKGETPEPKYAVEFEYFD